MGRTAAAVGRALTSRHSRPCPRRSAPCTSRWLLARFGSTRTRRWICSTRWRTRCAECAPIPWAGQTGSTPTAATGAASTVPTTGEMPTILMTTKSSGLTTSTIVAGAVAAETLVVTWSRGP
eukprot:Amastigsp_a176186_20.p3 type:complete len:122 gc:universal Amastigsp_a176186_20:377-12(-)